MFRFKRWHVTFAVLSFPVLFFLQTPEVQVPIHQASQTLFKPFLIVGRGVAYTSTSMRTQFYRFWNTFKSQEVYEEKILKLESKLIRYEEVMKENERLSNLLDFKRLSYDESVAARVIGWDLSLYRKTIILDKGSRDSLKKEQVITNLKGLVGKIVETGPYTSRVMLLIDPDSRFNVISHKTRSLGIVAGDGSGMLAMRYLDPASGIEVGEHVLTSGMGQYAPKGISIGKIEEIHQDEDGLHLIAKVRPFVDFSKLEEVLCLVY